MFHKVDIEIEENGIMECKSFPVEDYYGIYEYVRAFGYAYADADAVACWAEYAEDGEVYEMAGLYAEIYEDIWR